MSAGVWYFGPSAENDSVARNPRLVAARPEAWEGKDPGGARVLLANPGGEAVCSFLGAVWGGRTMADGTGEESAHAARMDGWAMRKARDGIILRGEG